MQNLATAHPEKNILATWLISLNGIKRSDVVRATKSNHTNLTQWLQGKEKLLSSSRQEAILLWLGLVNGKLDGSRIHRWEVANDFSALRGVLQATETPVTLASLTIHQVDNESSHRGACSPVLLEFDRGGAPVIILVIRPASAGRQPLALDCNTLGIGRNGHNIQIPKSLMEQDNLVNASSEIRECLRGSNSPSESDSSEQFGNIQTLGNTQPDQLLAEMKRENLALSNDVAYLRAHDAGLRAIIREALKTIRQLSPENILLDEKRRKEIYDAYFLNEAGKQALR